MKKTLIYTLLTIASLQAAMAQSDTTKTEAPSFTISAYADIYYGYNSAKVGSHEGPGFMYSYKRTEEVNLNLGYIKAAYSSGKVRANLALMAGTYAQYNLAAEQPLLQLVLEANAGVKLSNKHNLWFDAGIFASHIGFESAIGRDCWTLTRSIIADNTPYYESGAKLTYISKNEKWLLSALYLNGWQRIKRVDGNSTPAFGTQIQFKPSSKVLLNSSTFAGSDKPDSTSQMRYFHNLYGIFQLTDKFGVIADVDLGWEQKSKNSSDYNGWYSGALILKYAFTDKFSTAARVEYYDDQNGVIIATNTPNGFKTSGYSLNLDYAFSKNILLRLEGRMFNSKDKVFTEGTDLSNNNYMGVAAMQIAF